MQSGRPAEAIAPLQAAVTQSSGLLHAYALYNLGRSLRLAGRPADAIPVLQERLRYPDQRDVVLRELRAAQREAGQRPGNGSGGAKAKGGSKPHGKKHGE